MPCSRTPARVRVAGVGYGCVHGRCVPWACTGGYGGWRGTAGYRGEGGVYREDRGCTGRVYRVHKGGKVCTARRPGRPLYEEHALNIKYSLFCAESSYPP